MKNNMEKSTKKEKERYQLELFRSLCDDFPKGEISDGEKPDFIIDKSGSKIGIEVTRIYLKPPKNNNPLQLQESECQQLVAESQKIYEEMNLPKIDLRVLFSSDIHFSKKNRKVYANTLAKLVALNLPAHNSVKHIENDHESPNLFSSEIDTISIARFSNLKHNFWTTLEAGYVQEDFHHDLQVVINEKNTLLCTYDPSCNSHWLLIVAEWSHPSSFFDPSEQMLKESYKSGFDKIFFLNLFDQKINQLKIY